MTRRDYVHISREELEDWLSSLKWKWSRDRQKQGIYSIHLSQAVAVKLSSTVGRDDAVMGRGQASMQLSLISLKTGQLLNRKAKDRSHFQRTKGWRKTWQEGILHWEGVYRKSAGFYDAIAEIEDRDKYKADLLARIEARADWQNHDVLADFHNKVSQGGILTAKQVQFLDKILAEKAEPRSAPPSKGPRQLTPEQQAFLGRLDALEEKAQANSDRWLLDFLRSIRQRIDRGTPLTDGQKGALKKNLQRYKVGSVQAVAAAHMART